MTTAPPPDDSKESKSIASALIKARNERGYSQAQLAELTGVSRSAIKGYETGKNMPGSRELKALCLVLGVSPTALLYGSEEAFAARLSGGASTALDASLARWQLFALAKILPVEEVAALLQLARAIAVSRHGVDAVSAQLDAGRDTAKALSEPERSETQEELSRMVEALDLEDEAVLEELRAFVEHRNANSGNRGGNVR